MTLLLFKFVSDILVPLIMCLAVALMLKVMVIVILF